ncbi:MULTISPECIES: ABC transporter permease [unclassified Novosphingobium]|uniref:ABC transporter permease n=1 Tax=unclassified Novosphingobium TaxID=2644732 RepID=UPI001494DB37|nr:MULTISPECIES: ABC transporter permease [unclassified Novosphingobium]MBB3357883.1 NitT/TauT family transport system permease protein [Novosphingobium sp. BK256]MBB3374244.1 NitT/TauT family transport system permease protein [Novosphingobium sp. BK280]MBB3378656.1 NitT/TauT family transport system permease protein [Novosphingobium sp. BK258]MBB3420350.1 NitT/TauT family transport system permease protein [Novosphingobium sp. BK267]MBB3448528.1 NitT/TauT family transport system permease protei
MRWVNRKMRRNDRMIAGAVPILALLVLYLVMAAQRHAINPSDKILPLPDAMARGLSALLFQADPLSGHFLFWTDTFASLERLGLGLGIATLGALVAGLVLGVLPPVRATLGPLVTAIAVIPPIALLPVLFIALGLGETAKVALIVVGIAPPMIRDITDHIASLPREQIIKAQTLGASSWQIMIRVALPQAMPRLIQAVRLALGPAWVFLISAEAIAADTGLGYRIFLVRRYLAMDVIIPYVAWIALLAITLDFALSLASRRLFPWAHGASH